MGKERIPGRRPRLQGVAREVLVEVEDWGKIGLQERHADHMRSGRRLETDRHFRNGVAVDRSRGLHGRLLTACFPTIGRRHAKSTTTLPVEQVQAFAVEQHVELLARNRTETGWRHVVPEYRRDRDGVLAVGWKNVLYQHAAARSKRQSFD